MELQVPQLGFPEDEWHGVSSIGHPDHSRLLVNAIGLLTEGQVTPLVDGKRDLRLSLRTTASGDLAIHAINTAGRGRFLDEATPLVDVRLHVPEPVTEVTRLSDGARLAVENCEGDRIVIIDRLDAYERTKGDGPSCFVFV